MIKKQFITAIVMGYLNVSQINSMEPPEDSLESFNISTLLLGNYDFRQVDFEKLNERDHKTYITFTADFEAIQQMHGTPVACTFRPLLFFYPSLGYDLIIQERNKNAELSGKHTKIDWFIEQNNQFVGHIGLTGLSKDYPPEILAQINKKDDNIINISAKLSCDYRGKGIAKELLPLCLTRLNNAPAFKGKSILIATRTDNNQVHKLARNNGFADSSMKCTTRC